MATYRLKSSAEKGWPIQMLELYLGTIDGAVAPIIWNTWLKNNLNILPRSFAIATMLACMTSLPSAGAELRPYSLPSQQAAPRIEQHPMEQRAARPRVSEAYYQNFEKKVKRLKPVQRDKLSRSFERNREQAIESGRTDEEEHYRRLLQILQEAK